MFFNTIPTLSLTSTFDDKVAHQQMPNAKYKWDMNGRVLFQGAPS